MEALGANLGTYYTNFYREDEQRAQAIKNIDSATGGVLEPLLKSLADGTRPAQELRDSFRAIVEAQDLTTESGQRTYAALIGVSGAFAALTPAAAEASMAIEKAAASAAALASFNGSVMSAVGNEFAETKRAMDDFKKSFAEFRLELTGGSAALNDQTQLAALYQQFSYTSKRAAAGDALAMSQLSAVSSAYLNAAKQLAVDPESYISALSSVGGALDGANRGADLVVASGKEQMGQFYAAVSGNTTYNKPTPATDELKLLRIAVGMLTERLKNIENNTRDTSDAVNGRGASPMRVLQD